MKKKLLVPAIAGFMAVTLVGGVAVGTAVSTSEILLTVDGNTQNVHTQASTVADLLADEGIKLGENDVVLPAVETRIVDDMDVTVMVSRPIIVTVDGKARELWSNATTVEEALNFLDLNAPDSKLSASRSDAIGREGLSLDVITAKNVKVTRKGVTTEHRFAGSAAELLASMGHQVEAHDIITPDRNKVLQEGEQVTFVDVTITRPTKDLPIPFEKKMVESKDLAYGKTETTTKGANGIVRKTYENVYHDGVLQRSKKTSEKVIKEPVAEVVTVGMKGAPKDGLPPIDGGKLVGTKYDWMRSAGIPERDWRYVDFIVKKESNWNPRAVNRSSGACGLVQALPCSKLGPRWYDPVVALKWQHGYVKKRYGGYAGAYAFWVRNRWY